MSVTKKWSLPEKLLCWPYLVIPARPGHIVVYSVMISLLICVILPGRTGIDYNPLLRWNPKPSTDRAAIESILRSISWRKFAMDQQKVCKYRNLSAKPYTDYNYIVTYRTMWHIYMEIDVPLSVNITNKNLNLVSKNMFIPDWWTVETFTSTTWHFSIIFHWIKVNYPQGERE